MKKIFTNIPNNAISTAAAYSVVKELQPQVKLFLTTLSEIINGQMIQACDRILRHSKAQFFTVVTCLRSIWMTSGEMLAACWLSCSIFAAVSCSRRLTFAPESPLLSATFLWNSSSICLRYSAISLSASSFACLSLADLAVGYGKDSRLSCSLYKWGNHILLFFIYIAIYDFQSSFATIQVRTNKSNFQS